MDFNTTPQPPDDDLRVMRSLSPKRKSTDKSGVESLVGEQLAHYHIEPTSDYGRALARIVGRLYECGADLERLWRITAETVDALPRADRVAYFNAKKFLAFQIAKLLDTLQNPLRRTYQSLGYGLGSYVLYLLPLAFLAAPPFAAVGATLAFLETDAKKTARRTTATPGRSGR